MFYRPEIDGLRAVAVMPVILFHAGFGVFSGGFVGVDVFFVISGFLITGILIGELEQGNFSILRFYERRARRILPALFFVMLACVPFAYMWMLPAQLIDFGESIVAVIFFASNFLFWSEDGYFGSAAELKPLLHTWSLAVEEQYYLIFPILLMMLWSLGARKVFWIVAAMALCSLVFSEWSWRNAPSANFYLAPTRAWELLAGSLCAFLTAQQPQRSHNSLSALGLALILFSIFFFDERTPFPSVYALAPVVGTVLIILFAGPTTWTARILSTKGFVGIGLISYSAYLWHQPLFAFARLRSYAEPGPVLMGGLAILALILAWGSWRWVEQPFRKRGASAFDSQRSIFVASGVCACGFVVVGAVLAMGDGGKDRWDSAAAFLAYENHDIEYFQPDCFLTSARNDFALFEQSTCLSVSELKPNILVMGNSHAGHLALAVRDEYPQANVMQATSSGCSGLQPLRGASRCRDLFEFIYNDFLPQNPVDVIVFSSRLQERDVGSVDPTLEILQTHAETVVLVGPVPEYHPDLYISLAKALRFEAQAGIEQVAAMTLDDSRFGVDAALGQVVQARTDVAYFSILDTFCTPSCPVFASDGALATFDYGHLTYSAARDVARAMASLINLD